MNTLAKFPTDISYGSVGGPNFSTSITKLSNGKEQRSINRSRSCCKYNVIYGVKSEAELTALIDFFYAHRGKAVPFRFKDWTDYKALHQKIGIGDGVISSCQLLKTYSAGAKSYKRVVTKPVEETVKIYLGDILQAREKDYTIDCGSGVVSFKKPPEPQTTVYADFEFDILARFDTDYLPCSIDGYNSFRCAEIPLVEVIDY